MQPISEGEFLVLGFLVRHPFEKVTVRELAKRVKLTPPGVHLIFKKLEKDNLVFCEKLGSGLFYSINFENDISKHLACILLIERRGPVSKEILEQQRNALFCIGDGKELLFVSDELRDVSVSGFTCSVMSPEEFVKGLRKDSFVKEMVEKGTCLFNEMEAVKLLGGPA